MIQAKTTLANGLVQAVGDFLDHQAQVFGVRVVGAEQAAAGQRRPDHRRHAQVLQAVEGFVEHRRHVQRRELDLVGGQRTRRFSASNWWRLKFDTPKCLHLAGLLQAR
jgi:hypothetical protein